MEKLVGKVTYVRIPKLGLKITNYSFNSFYSFSHLSYLLLLLMQS